MESSEDVKKNVIENFNETTFEADHYYELFHDGTVKDITEEIPFDVPEGWEWERLRNIYIVNPKNDITDSMSVSFVPMAFIEDGYSGNFNYEVKKWESCKKGYTHFANNDVGFAKISPCFENRKSAIFKNLENGYGSGTTELYILRSYKESILPNYTLLLVKTGYFIGRGIGTFSGVVGQQRVNKEIMLDTFIPVPPYNEQIRLSEKTEQLIQNASDISINGDRLNTLIDRTKTRVLDLAIRGKLLPQDPNDEPASVLLDRIRAEKEELIKQGKLKRDKKESIIYKGDDNCYYEQMGKESRNIDEEIPFELPETWKWCRLKTIVQIINGDRGSNYPAKNKLHDSGIPFVSASNIDNGKVSHSSGMKYLSNEQYNLLRAGLLRFNDIVYCIRGSLGKCGIFPYEKGAIASSLVIVRPYLHEKSIIEYLMLYFTSALAFFEIKKYDNGTAQPNLAAKDFENFLIPLPPLNMVEKIVDKTKKMLDEVTIIQEVI